MSEYIELQNQIAVLQKRVDAILAAERQTAVKTINELVASFGITRSEISFSNPAIGESRASANTARKRHPTAGQRAPVKFRDAQGSTWAGRGLQPKWLRNALAAGATLDSFRA